MTYTQNPHIAKVRRDALQAELESVYSNAPSTFASAYKKAQGALQINEDFTFNDGEIDKFLPNALKMDK